ncbi:hypothetical protein NST74_13010 [Paenibacillus sp. FSL F4-0125]|uniref:hypothetical protein n=1 Tax=Paenibacillus sp. FSL F4-0125 TaxID=2954730 RepID=UPI0030FD042D
MNNRTDKLIKSTSGLACLTRWNHLLPHRVGAASPNNGCTLPLNLTPAGPAHRQSIKSIVLWTGG